MPCSLVQGKIRTLNVQLKDNNTVAMKDMIY